MGEQGVRCSDPAAEKVPCARCRTRWGGSEEGGVKKTARGGQPVGLQNSRGKECFYCVRVGQWSNYAQLLLGPSHADASVGRMGVGRVCGMGGGGTPPPYLCPI